MTIDVIFQAVDKVSKSIDGIGKSIDKISQSVSNFGGKMIAINQSIEAFDRMGQAVDEITAPYREFEQSMAELSSITGIVGDELGMLGEVARKTGVESGLGAKGAANAFALLASQIDVSKIGMDGLIGLQKETITLAQAAGMTMDESANAMAGTINQFGLQATEANRVINVLAAGSKYGAASIPDLAQSFKVVGAAANAAGLSIEDTAGIVEVLSKNNLKGAEAGTAMRNIMLKMQTTLGVDFTKTSFADALDALKPKMKDAAYMSKVFGMESMAAAQFLIANSDSVREMTQRVTDTNVATEQAVVNTDTWNFSLSVQAAKMDEMLMSFTESNKEIFSLLQTGSQWMRLFTSFAPLFQMVKTGALAAKDGIRWLTKGVESLGGKSRLAAAGIWVKNTAISVGQGIMTAYNFITNATNWSMMRQMVVTKASAIWTAICSKAQLVASTISTLWAKRTAILTVVQGGLSKALNIAKITMLTGVIPALTGIIASTWAWTVALLANPITWIVLGIMALIAAIVYCWNEFEGFRAVIYTIWDTIVGFGEAIYNYLVAPFAAAWEFLKGIGNAIGSLFGGDFEQAGADIAAGFNNGLDTGLGHLKKSGNAIQKATSFGDNYDKNLTEDRKKQAAKEAANTPKKETPTLDPAMDMPNIDMANFDIPTGGAMDMPKMASLNTQSTTSNNAMQQGGNVDITFNPTINISGDMSQKSKEDFLAMLKNNASEMARLIKEELRKQERGNYGVSAIG